MYFKSLAVLALASVALAQEKKNPNHTVFLEKFNSGYMSAVGVLYRADWVRCTKQVLT